MSAASVLADLRREGVAIRVVDGEVRLRPTPGRALSPDLVERARAEKAALLRVLRPEMELPAAVDAGLHLLKSGVAPAGFMPTRWRSLVDGAERFTSRWTAPALALGWSVLDLYGVHPIAPAARVDCLGLALVLGERDVAAIDEHSAAVRSRRGDQFRFYKPAASGNAVLIWKLMEARS